MTRASALLGSCEEAAEMLSDDGITLSVNRLREVCGGIGRKLVQITASGTMRVEGSVEKRRIVVSMDGGRVRLREPRKGRTKRGRKKFTAKWREPRLFIIYAVEEHGRLAGGAHRRVRLSPSGTTGCCNGREPVVDQLHMAKPRMGATGIGVQMGSCRPVWGLCGICVPRSTG